MGSALQKVCADKQIPFIASTHRDADITDLNNLKYLASSNRATLLINCAAFTDVDGAEKASREAYEINAKGPENLSKLASEFPIKIIHLSTDYVFDGEKSSPYTEEDTPRPLGVYGKSKYEGELRLLEGCPNACVVRTSWVFGPGGKNFISSIPALLNQKEHVQAVTDQINRPTYHVDLARDLLSFASQQGIFHYANTGILSRYQIVLDFYEELQRRGVPLACQKISPLTSEAFPARSPRPKYSVLSTEKTERVLGRKPRLWKTVLEEYLDQLWQHTNAF